MMNGVVDKLCSIISIWNLICIGFICLVRYVVYVDGIAYGKIIAPTSYTALTHDLDVEFQTTEVLPLEFLNLKLSYLGEPAFHNIHHINFYTDEQTNSTKIKVPCSLFTRAGPYVLHVDGNAINTTLSIDGNHLLEHKLDVRWPNARLSVTHENIETYDQSVSAVIEFLDVECPIDTTSIEDVPSFHLELIYCGLYDVVCDSHTVPSNSTFFIQLVRGIQKSIVVPLNCEYFGLAGNYVLHLRPLPPLNSSLSAKAYIKADWSKQYILNIMDIKSTYDCADAGIRVVVKYPACIMDNDRVRLYGKLPADVHSIARPTSLVYVNERKIERGQHNVYFNCELFNERFIEYCFVYVTEAKSGAVADIRSDCVPTSPVYGPIDGKWGRWSNWTECSAKYAWGIQTRYRICDSPTPKYNGKYCEGPTTEQRPCSGSISNIWEYFFGTKSFGSINSTDIMDEVGPSCQCGCIIHLLKSKPRRLLATSTQSCPGMENAMWTIQVEEGHQIQFNLDYFVLPCPTQSIKVRDGKDAWMSELIGEYTGRGVRYNGNVLSSGDVLLIDFHMNDSQIVNNACYAGFIGHVEIIDPANVTLPNVAESSIMGMLTKDHRAIIKFNYTHLFVFLFCGIILLISVFLGAQYIFRYHRYQLAKSKEESDSPLNTPHGSIISITRNPQDGNMRAISTSTLMSEVVTLVKLKPKTSSAIRHKKLRESVVSQDFEKDQLNDSDSIGNYSNNGSTNTLTNDVKEEDLTPILLKKKSYSAPESDTSSSSIFDTSTPVPKKKLSLDGNLLKRDISSNTVKELLKEKCEELQEKDLDEASSYSSSIGRTKTVSPAATLTSGNYSPALSLTSTARIRLNNQKESKEKKNRLKLMANPGSQYSISTQEEMEMDYYDYNVVNASAAPGSYLGMDPAFLIWIPPIDENHGIISDLENDGEEILPSHSDIDPGSNKESPDEQPLKVPIKPPRKSLISPSSGDSTPLTTSSNGSNGSGSSSNINPKEILSKINFLQKTAASIAHEKTSCGSNENLQHKSPTKHVDVKRISIVEKETSVIKSPSDNRICEYYELSDIKFVDDDMDDVDVEDTAFEMRS